MFIIHASASVLPVAGRFVSSVVPWVETIRERRAEGCGLPGGAEVCNDWYRF